MKHRSAASVLAVVLVATTFATLVPAPASAQEIVRACVLDRPPIARCSLIDPTDPSKWEEEGGFAVRLFEQAWSNAGVNDGDSTFTAIHNTSIEWRCMNEKTSVLVNMLASADKANRTCDVLISSTTVTTERKKMGLSFSYPFASPALSTAVKGSVSSQRGIFWLKPFTWTLWVTIVGTVFIFVPLMMVVFLSRVPKKSHSSESEDKLDTDPQASSNANHATPTTWLQNFMFGMFNGTSVVLHGDNRAWDNLQPTKFVNVAWVARSFFFSVFGFVTLVLISAYTANFSAVLVLPEPGSEITDTAQLYGKQVLTASLYFDHLRNRYGIQPKDAEITNGDSMMLAASRVSDGEYAAIVYDFPMLVWAVNKHNTEFGDTCIRLLDHRFLPRQYAYAFANGFNQQFVELFSNVLNALDDLGELARQREMAWERITNNDVMLTCRTSTESGPLGVTDVWVLFVILAASGAFSAVLSFLPSSVS